MLSAFAGVIDFIVYLTNPTPQNLAASLYLLMYVPAAIAFTRLLTTPSKERAQSFSDWYIISIIISHAALFVLLALNSLALAFIDTIILGGLSIYLWLCVSSYARAYERFQIVGATANEQRAETSDCGPATYDGPATHDGPTTHDGSATARLDL